MFKFGNIRNYLVILGNMLIPPKYTLTNKISELLQKIEASKAVINSISIPPQIEINIRRQSVLKSALYSARIEGNPLTLDEINNPSKTQSKIEIFNILKALEKINHTPAKDLNISDILEIHALVLKDLSVEAGKFRTEHSAIFNSAGIAVYLPPQPRYIKTHLEQIVDYIKSERERFIPIKAVLGHYLFEKVHPFMDGNGRVGRVLIQKKLLQAGYGMKGLFNIEEYLDNNRSSYYKSLDEPEKEATSYVEFMLEAISLSAEKAKDLVTRKQKPDPLDFLLPRRAEIYHIIKDHQLVQFDQIRRRFVNVNERTLRYDLKKLQDGGFITKLGTTKGVYYKVRSEN